ncbi:MAG: hypothetical protein GY950_28660, partial [bacterium]|nr:hypothetical protein [bacterium]
MKLLDDEYARDIREKSASGRKICLDFEIYARAFVELAVKTTEPITFGIFGEWGTGKTTLMRSINKIFDDEFKEKVYTVWFNPWEYPPEEDIVKAMLQTMIVQEWYPKLSNGKNAVRSTLDVLLKSLSSIIPGVPDLTELKNYIEKNQSKQELKPSSFMSLRKTFEEFVNHLTTEINGERSLLVFFIDDLD